MDRELDDLEGFWVREDPSRTLHIGWEDEETLYFDLFDSKSAAPGHPRATTASPAFS